MLLKSLVSSALIGASFLKSVVAEDLPTIEVVGSKFFFSNNGSEFFMRGVAYQQNNANTDEAFVDPLADTDSCTRDIPYLQELNTNVIRVYALNTSLNHDGCMSALNDAGIYVIADLSEPDLSIDRSAPAWNLELYSRYVDVVEQFHNYSNVLGFFAGNEVTNAPNNTDASAFVKAAVRDTKAYISAQGYRTIPVGYSGNDDASYRVAIADYFACGDEEVRADFYGINMYEWCGVSTFEESGYADRTAEMENLTIPAFFSEYGCNVVQPRKFTEVAALYGPNMTDVWSGGIVYMYFEEANNFGLVTIESDGSVSTMADFAYYSSEINAISPSSANTASYSEAATALACPTQDSNWQAATALPPTPNSAVCDCMAAAVSCSVASDVAAEDYQDMFDFVCSVIDCSGISANGTSGEYGAYSFCSAKDQLSFVMNLYYESQGSASSACDFSGSGTILSASTASSCSSILSAAGTDGLGAVSVSGVVSAATSGTSGSGSGSGSVSGSGSSSSSSSSSSAKASAGVRTYGSSSELYMALVLSTSFVAGMLFIAI